MSTPDPQWVALQQQLAAAADDPTRAALAEQLHARYLALARGGTTPGGLPYPSPTDPFAEGADAIRALAEAVDDDTGWIPFGTPSSGWSVVTANPPQARRVGRTVRLRGFLQNSAFTGGFSTALTLPPGIPAPGATASYPVSGNASVIRSIQVTSAGAVQFYAAGTSTAYFGLMGAAYFTDSPQTPTITEENS